MPEIIVGIIYIVMEIETGKLFQGGRTGRVSPCVIIIVAFVEICIAPLVISCDAISQWFRCLHVLHILDNLRTLRIWVSLFFKYAAPRTVIVVVVVIIAQYFTID